MEEKGKRQPERCGRRPSLVFLGAGAEVQRGGAGRRRGGGGAGPALGLLALEPPGLALGFSELFGEVNYSKGTQGAESFAPEFAPRLSMTLKTWLVIPQNKGVKWAHFQRVMESLGTGIFSLLVCVGRGGWLFSRVPFLGWPPKGRLEEAKTFVGSLFFFLRQA